MSDSGKITSSHLSRAAVIYVRQSTLMQVERMRIVLPGLSKLMFGGRCGSYGILRKGLVPSKKVAPSWQELSTRLPQVACDFWPIRLRSRYGFASKSFLLLPLSSCSRPPVRRRCYGQGFATRKSLGALLH